MRWSCAIPEAVNEVLLRHLAREDGQEDLCFAVWYPSEGATRKTALLRTVVLPEGRDRAVHGNASYSPSFFERGLAAAMSEGGGLVFLHSHPGGGWQGMSQPDIYAEKGMAAAALSATGLPLLGMTLGATDGAWSARLWERTGPKRYRGNWCDTVRVVGGRLGVTFHPKFSAPGTKTARLTRTRAAWGDGPQETLERLRFGVIGLGSVGSIVCEALARVGAGDVVLLDHDALEELNLDRTLHATRQDAHKGAAKVARASQAFRQSATAERIRVRAMDWSVCEEQGFLAALDCDVLFSCVDRPWARSVLNVIATAHLIPVIDGGIFVSRVPSRAMRGADWKAHTVVPGQACLECIKQFDPGLVAADREGYLDDPTYIEALPDDHPIKNSANVFPFSLAAASLEVLQMLQLVIGPAGVGLTGTQNYHFVPGTLDRTSSSCKGDCPYLAMTAKGDHGGHPGTARHAAAEAARAKRHP